MRVLPSAAGSHTVATFTSTPLLVKNAIVAIQIRADHLWVATVI
jgi:hypothetical protein